MSSGIVRSGYQSRAKGSAAEAFVIESLRDQHRDMASKYSKLRGAVLDWMHSRGLEAEPEYLVRLEREVGRHR